MCKYYFNLKESEIIDEISLNIDDETKQEIILRFIPQIIRCHNLPFSLVAYNTYNDIFEEKSVLYDLK